MSEPWPSSPLAAAERAFDLLSCLPAPLSFDARGLTGLPSRAVPLPMLRELLVCDRTPRAVRDQVWRTVVIRARRDGPAWVIAAVGLAMPGLRRAAGRLTAGWRGDTRDVDSELLTGFLARLHTVDVEAPRICGRLIDAGVRAVRHARRDEERSDAVHVDGAWSLPPHHPWDHPDWVLLRAVAQAVIDADEHLLISATRLDDVPLREVADELGITVQVAAAWRRKAERRLADAIAVGELDWAPVARPQHPGRASARSANHRPPVPHST